MWPAPTARARPSPSCARSWRAPGSRCMSTPRRIWCASTSASGSAALGGGRFVDEDRLVEALRRCEAVNAGAPITVFEITTAAAFLLFAETPADVLLLEVGLGGRFDATNVIDRPAAAVVTPIGYDHAEYLGDTLEKIAVEKAGIFKRGCPAVIAPQDYPAADAVLRAEARSGRRLADPGRRSRISPSTRSAAGSSIRTRTACSTCRGRASPAATSSSTPAPRSRPCAPPASAASRPAAFEAGLTRRRMAGAAAAPGRGPARRAWRRRAASSGSTAATTPTAAGCSPPPWPT